MPLVVNDAVAGEYCCRCSSSSGRTDSFCAVEKDRIERAVRPLVSAANDSLRVDAELIVGDTNFILRISDNLWKLGGRSTEPDITMLGFFQAFVSGSCDGGPPMIPPSMK